MGEFTGRRVESLAYDGWENADLYHWMMDSFALGKVTIFLPDVAEGPPAAWQDAMRVQYRGLLDHRGAVRRATFSALAKQAHDLYEVRET